MSCATCSFPSAHTHYQPPSSHRTSSMEQIDMWDETIGSKLIGMHKEDAIHLCLDNDVPVNDYYPIAGTRAAHIAITFDDKDMVVDWNWGYPNITDLSSSSVDRITIEKQILSRLVGMDRNDAVQLCKENNIPVDDEVCVSLFCNDNNNVTDWTWT